MRKAPYGGIRVMTGPLRVHTVGSPYGIRKQFRCGGVICLLNEDTIRRNIPG